MTGVYKICDAGMDTGMLGVLQSIAPVSTIPTKLEYSLLAVSFMINIIISDPCYIILSEEVLKDLEVVDAR